MTPEHVDWDVSSGLIDLLIADSWQSRMGLPTAVLCPFPLSSPDTCMHGRRLPPFFVVLSLIQGRRALGPPAVGTPAWKQRPGFVASELQAPTAEASPANLFGWY